MLDQFQKTKNSVNSIGELKDFGAEREEILEGNGSGSTSYFGMGIQEGSGVAELGF